MKRKSLAVTLIIITALTTLVTISLRECNKNNKNTVVDSIENSSEAKSENFETVFKNDDINISVDTNSISYDKDTKQFKFKVNAVNNGFVAYDIGINSVIINDNKDNTNEIYFGDSLGSAVISDSKNTEIDRTAIITTNNTIDSIDKLEVSFVLYNADYEIKLITSNSVIEVKGNNYNIKEASDINTEESDYNEDYKADLEEINNKAKSSEYSIFGTHKLGYIVTDKLGDVRTLSYNENEYSVADDNISIKVYKDNIDYGTIYNECDSLITKSYINTQGYEIEGTEVNLVYVKTEDNYIRCDVTLHKNDSDETLVISLSTYTYDESKFKDIITSILKSYTLIDLNSIDTETL